MGRRHGHGDHRRRRTISRPVDDRHGSTARPRRVQRYVHDHGHGPNTFTYTVAADAGDAGDGHDRRDRGPLRRAARAAPALGRATRSTAIPCSSPAPRTTRRSASTSTTTAMYDFVDINGDNCPDNGDAAFVETACQTAPVIAGCHGAHREPLRLSRERARRRRAPIRCASSTTRTSTTPARTSSRRAGGGLVGRRTSTRASPATRRPTAGTPSTR